jgi:S1-C subfamily serine protease
MKAAATVARSIVSLRPIEGVQTLRSVPLYSDVQNRTNIVPFSMVLPPGISGIAIDAEGYVLTSANVAELGPRVQVIFDDGAQGEAAIVAVDTEEFVALLKVSSFPAGFRAPDLLRSSSELKPGEWLVRQGRSPTGRVSLSLCSLESVRLMARDRSVGILDSTTAPEMDGGVLTDMSGGIRGVYVSPSRTSGFVIPIGRALGLAGRLKAAPVHTARSWLGLELQDVTQDLRDYFGVETGAVVTKVVPDGPAFQANLRSSDIIQTVDEEKVKSASELSALISDKPPGTPLRLGIRRGTQNRTVAVVTALPSGEELASSDGGQTLVLEIEDTVSASGAAIVDVRPRSLANRLGLLSGDVIKAVNGRPVRRSAELAPLLRTLTTEKPRLFQIQRGERNFFVGIKEAVRIDG